MKKRLILIVALLALIVAGPVFISCSSKSCGGVVTSPGGKSKYAKKNKSYYRQKFSYKPRSVRKDYVIKNGIAH